MTDLKRLFSRCPPVIIHGGTPKGVEKAAACWVDHRKVTQIGFKPDWAADGKAAPLKRNDRMLEIVPAGVIVFPGSGITGNLADKARRLGIRTRSPRGRRVRAGARHLAADLSHRMRRPAPRTDSGRDGANAGQA